MRQWIATMAALALIVGGAMWVRAADDKAASSDKKTVEGELIDMHCYSAGGAKGEEHGEKCGAKCLSSGIPAGILVDGKAWTLATNPKPLAKDCGKTIRVTGDINEDTHAVLPDKIEVKDGDNWKEVNLKDAHHGKDAE